MNNQQIIETLVAKLSNTIDWYMNDLEGSYEEAKEYCKERTVAGIAVWEILDAKYS